MMKMPAFLNRFKIHHEPDKHSSLRHRFIAGVLTPPFFVLLALGVVIIWQLNGFVRNQAIEELNRAASTTAAKLEREFALRQTVLKRTGEELFIIKSQYQSDLTKLDQNRSECSTHLKQGKDFRTSPNASCAPFYSEFTNSGVNTAAVESGYVAAGQELAKTQKSQINERLTSFGQFFPETVALIVTDGDGKVVSSAMNEVFKGSTEAFSEYVSAAKSAAVEGKVITTHDFKLAVFAYPIASGSVLAAYDVSSENFIYETWKATPINNNQALAVIVDSQGQPAYPGSAQSDSFKQINEAIRTKRFATMSFNDITHIATGSVAKGSDWAVIVASPRTVVLSPVRDAQIAAVFIVGGLLVGFLWVGTFFIQRTLRSIIRLVSGSLIFAAGKLDYKINLDSGDEEFVALANTMNNMAARIAAAEKEIDEKNKEFISIATHELRTPLTAIKGNLSMVYEDFGDQLNETLKPLVEQAYTGTTRLAALVNDMLDMARLEGNRVEFAVASQDIQTIANNVVETLRVVANEKQVSLSYVPANAQPVVADASKLWIVINNFVSNAIKYNRPDGTVTVSHSRHENSLVTTIADTGLGIPEDQKAHMFEKFFRVQHDDRKSVVGTGLGMYITREYVIKMGGQVWFESVHGQGTTFHFTLPLAATEPAVAATSPTKLPEYKIG